MDNKPKKTEVIKWKKRLGDQFPYVDVKIIPKDWEKEIKEFFKDRYAAQAFVLDIMRETINQKQLETLEWLENLPEGHTPDGKKHWRIITDKDLEALKSKINPPM